MPPKIRVMQLKGHRVTVPARAHGANRFDVRATSVGESKWTGSDGKPVAVFYDPASRGGQSLAQDILAHRVDDIMAFCDRVFGVQGQGGNVIVVPGDGGAYHYGCDFRRGGDWYEDDMGLTGPSPDNNGGVVTGLVMAEVSESYMGLQGRGWDCGGSGGEALSRVLAEAASGGIAGAMSGGFSARSSYDGHDWISRDQGTDGDYPSIGCGMLYLDWMLSLGHKLEAIVQAGCPDGTLASNYAALTGSPRATAWPDYQSAVAVVDQQAPNPFGVVDVPFPGGTVPPTPPVPPDPTPTPTPTPGNGYTGTLAYVDGRLIGVAAPAAAGSLPWAAILAIIQAIIALISGGAQPADILSHLQTLPPARKS